MGDSLNQYLSKLNNYIGVFIMGNKSYLLLSGVLLLSILFWSACNNPGSSLEESVEPYLELESIEEASSTTVTVNKGETHGLDSFFAFDLSNIKPNGFVSNGLKEGWCLEWNKPLDSNNGVQTDVKMFNTHGSASWKPANYLMNIKDDLQSVDPELTYREIQVALWSLIEVPAFNIDKALQDGTMPSRMLTNGSPNFNVEKTKGIIDKVRNECDDFVYKTGTPVIVYSNMASEYQDGGFVTGETAWAFSRNPTDGSVNSSISKEFCGNNNLGINKWGWTNGPFVTGDSGSFDIIAGAGQCDLSNGELVGTFAYEYKQNGEFEYTLDLTVDNDYIDLHLYVGSTELPLENGSFTAAPGQFPYNVSISSGIGQTSNTLSQTFSGDIYIAVHLGPL